MAGPFAVQTTNKFAFLDEDASDAPAPVKEKKEKDVKKKPEPRKENKPRENKERAPRNGTEGGARRGGGKGGGRGGGKGGGRGGRDGKREFDRRSGSGVRDTQRKVDRGWTDERKKNPEVEKTAEAPAEGEATPEAAAPAEGEPAEPAEPEQLTYDEVLARRAAAALEEDVAVAVRKVENDDSMFKSSNAFKAEDTSDLENKYELGTANKKKGKKGAKPKKATGAVNIDEFMTSGNQRKGGQRGGKGGRGGGKGGKGGRITIDDKNFPKLG